MKNLLTACLVMTFAIVPFALTGCKPAPPAQDQPEGDAGHDEHVGHDHDTPGTYAEAVGKLEGLHASIRDAFEKKDKDAAHGPLHDVGNLLESVGALAEKAELDAEQLTAVKKAKEELFDGYTKIDGMFHGEEEVAYADLAKGLDAALAVLQSAVKKETAPEESPEESPK
ncbi:MAG: hypothetical protein JKY95_07075 [Planctomycetaceae bacterium]|nr:hypothetical protein [Planctomycetaceae bacterium]